MTLMIGALGFALFLVLLSTAGAYLVRNAAPVLMRRPRFGVTALGGVLLVWLLGVAALGPMLAWTATGTGPSALLPQRAGEVCQRCLEAANPLAPGDGIDILVPALPLLVAPLVMLAVLSISAVRTYQQRRRSVGSLCRTLSASATRSSVLGFEVTVVQDAGLSAYALPGRCPGIVVSQRLLDTLSESELRAVLTHEHAHLRQRHHLILAVLEAITAPIRRVPLVRTIRHAIPHYLEVAADHAAREQSSTSALASALLKLGESPSAPADAAAAAPVTLHAAGTERIRQLVAPQAGAATSISALAVLAMGLVLMIISSAVHLPYAHAVASGCLVM